MQTNRDYRRIEIVTRSLDSDSLIWFGRSWATAVAIGSRLYFPRENCRWEAWVSLKFTGNTWGGGGEDRVVCDRVILVTQPTSE